MNNDRDPEIIIVKQGNGCLLALLILILLALLILIAPCGVLVLA